MDNLFWSEEHLNAFLEAYPNYKKLTHATLGDFLERLKKRQGAHNRKSEQGKTKETGKRIKIDLDSGIGGFALKKTQSQF